MKHYYEKETKEHINYLKEIKHKFITIVVKNYEKSIERLSTELIKEKEESQSLSTELADTLSNFEKCEKELVEASNVNKYFVENIALLEKSVADLVEQKEVLSSKLNNSEERNEICLNEIDSLKSDEVKYKYELDQLENEKRKLTSHIQSLEGRNEDLFSKLSISEEINKEVLDKITLSEETIEYLRRELNQEVSDKIECVNKFEVLNNDYKQLNIQNDDISTKLVSAMKSNAESITRIQFLEEEIQQKRTELNKVMCEKSECVSELEALVQNYQKVSKIAEELTLKLVISEDTIEEKKNQFDKVISDNNECIKQINNIKKDLEELTKSALELSSKNKEQSNQLIELQTTKETYSNIVKMIAMYNQELNKILLNVRRQQSAVELSDHQRADSSLNISSELNTTEKSQYEELDEITYLGKQISEINHYINLYHERENVYLNEKHSLKGELATIKNNYQKITVENEGLTLKLGDSEGMIKEHATKIKHHEEAIKQNKEELNKVISEKDKYVTQKNIIRNNYEDLTKRALQLFSENEEKNKLLIKKEGDYINLIKSVTIFNEQLDKVVNNLKIQLVITEKSDSHKPDTSSNISNELNNIEKCECDHEFDEISQLGKQISEINSYIHLYSEREKIYLNEKNSLEEKLTTNKNDFQELTEIIGNLTSKCAVSEKTIGEYTTQIELLEETIEQKNDELKEIISEKDKYVTRINNIQHDYEELTKRSLQLSTDNEEKNKLLIGKKLKEEEYINLIKTIAMYNEQLDKVVRNLKGQQPVTEMTELQKAYNSFNKLSVFNSPIRCKSDEKTDEINQLGEKISKINAYIDLYSEKETFYLNEIDSLKGELATTSTNHFELTQNLKDQNCDNESMITSLTENLHSIIEKYNQLQIEHREYLNKISEYQAEITKLKKTYSEVTVSHEMKITNLQDEILKLEGEILSLKNIHGNETERHGLKVKLLQDKLSGSDEEICLLKREIEKATIEYDIIVNPLKERSSKLEEEKRVFEEELQRFKVEYASEVEILRRSISNNEELINALKMQCEDYETRISTLQVQIALGKEELSQLKLRSGRTAEEYESTLANLQVQVVGSRLEVTKLTSKIEALLVDKEDLQRRIKALEEELNEEIQKRTTVSDELEKEHEVITCLRNELAKKEILLKDVKMFEELQVKCEKLQQESSDRTFLEEKQIELQQKIETLMGSNETQEKTYEVFKIYFKEFRGNLDKVLSQKNILETLTNNLRVLVVSINKNVPGENLYLKTLFEKKEAMEVIAEDIMKQYNRCTKQTHEIVFDVLKYYERSCDNLLTTFDIKIENYSEKYNLVELNDQISDLTERTADALEQVKILQKDLENLSKVEDVKIQKENILGASRKINVDKMKEDDFRKKNLVLRQKVTLLENAKGNLEKTVKKLREENRKIKEGTDKTAPSNDAHYNMLLQEYVAYKEKHDEILKEYKTKLTQLQKEYEELKNGCMRTSTPIGDEHELPTKTEKRLQADLAGLREAYSSIRSIKAKLETENVFSTKLLEEQKREIGKFNFMKEAYEKLLEENSKLMTDVDTIKYKRTRDRDEFLRLLKKERSENDSRNAGLIQEIRGDYEAKLEKMKEKMIKLYREEVNKEMSKLKEGQHESSSLLKIIEQLKGDLFEAEQKVQVLQAERDIRRRNRDQTSLHGSRESFSSFQLHDSDTRSLRDFPSSSFVGSSSAVAKSSALSAAARPSEFKHPNSAKSSSLDARRQAEVRRVSTLPRTGTVVEEVTVTRRTSFGVPDSIGPNLHMEDEEEMFNNKYLADLKQGKCDLPATDDRDSRVSELAWRNSLVPPHLKSSYPAEMQFCSPGRFKDDDIKAGNLPFDDSLSKLLPGEKSRKKDFGTTSYKKPGPPTPSKNGGRISLQGNEVHPAREPPTEAKKSTPSRIRALFTGRNSSKSGAEMSPPKRRLNIFRR